MNRHFWARDGTSESMISVGTQTVLPINVAYSRCVENRLQGSKISMQAIGGGVEELTTKGMKESMEGNPFKFSGHGPKLLSY